MTLALAVPVHNDAEALSRLLQQAAEMDAFDQIVICDDGSDTPVTRDLAPLKLRAKLQILRHDQPQGAGIARNRTIAAVNTSHLLFFDSDDLLTAEFPPLWRSLASETFDFCLFRHHDSRSAVHKGWGQMPGDNQLWRQAGMGGKALTELTGDQRRILAETANYPWNKIYRTGFLRAHGLGCAEIEVHEDVELHWLSFLRAERILASDRIAAQHFVHSGGQRLSNRRDAARLAAFESFSDVAAHLAEPHSERDLLPGFLRFISGLALWMRAHLDATLHQRLDAELAKFLRANTRRSDFAALATADPALGLRLLTQMHGAALTKHLKTPTATELLALYDETAAP